MNEKVLTKALQKSQGAFKHRIVMVIYSKAFGKLSIFIRRKKFVECCKSAVYNFLVIRVQEASETMKSLS